MVNAGNRWPQRQLVLRHLSDDTKQKFQESIVGAEHEILLNMNAQELYSVKVRHYEREAILNFKNQLPESASIETEKQKIVINFNDDGDAVELAKIIGKKIILFKLDKDGALKPHIKIHP